MFSQILNERQAISMYELTKIHKNKEIISNIKSLDHDFVEILPPEDLKSRKTRLIAITECYAMMITDHFSSISLGYMVI